MGMSRSGKQAVSRSGRYLFSVFRQGLVTTCCLAATVSVAQEQLPDADSAQGVPRAWSIAPRVTIQETYTDNVGLVASNPQSDWITDISPGVRINGRTKRLRLNVDYGIHELLYAQGTRGHQTQRTLNSEGTLEALENLLYVDMSGAIMRQNVSALGTQSTGNYSATSNNTETSTFRVSPYVKGKLAGAVDYEGRYSRTTSSSKSSGLPRSDLEVWSGVIGGDTPLARFGWTADADHQKTSYDQEGLSIESSHWRGLLNYRITPELMFSISKGQERNNYVTPTQTSYDTHGFGIDWRPGERTQFSAFKEKRFFGDGHTVMFSHRMAQSAIQYSDSRDVSTTPSISGTVYTTIYDMLFSLYATAIPEENARAAFVNNLLAAYQVAPNTLIPSSLLTGQATAQRRQQLSYVLNGARNSFTVTLMKSHSDRLGTLILAGSDFSQTSSITQEGLLLGWTHKLSGLSTLSVNGSRTRSASGSDLNAQSTANSVSASISTRIGARTNGMFTARRTVSDASGAGASSYTENALVGTVSVEF